MYGSGDTWVFGVYDKSEGLGVSDDICGLSASGDSEVSRGTGTHCVLASSVIFESYKELMKPEQCPEDTG